MPSRAEGCIDVFRHNIYSCGKEVSLPFSIYVALGRYELYEFLSFPEAQGPVSVVLDSPVLTR